MNHNIEVTVLMPAYNVEDYIGEAITSVLGQTFKEFELIIVNDGSTDNTESVIKRFDDARIKIINQKNSGVSAALNAGLKEARGKYIVRFDADDVCYPDRIKTQYDFMVSHPNCVIVGSDADYMDVDGELLFSYRNKGYSDSQIRNLRYNICPFIHSSVCYLKDVVLEVGAYDINAHTFEDHLLWNKLLSKGEANNINRSLIKVRLNPSSVTIDEKWRGKKFSEIKYAAIKRKSISDEDGEILKNIIKVQNFSKFKEAAYYSLVAKKYLWNKHNSKKAKLNIYKAIRLQPNIWSNYILFACSFLPSSFISFIYKKFKKNKTYDFN